MLLASLHEAITTELGGGGGAVELDLHPLSILIVIALFLVLMGILKPVLFEPMLALFEEREKQTDGAKDKARVLDAESAVALQKYEDEIGATKADAMKKRDEIRGQGLRAETDILAKARDGATSALESGKAEVEAAANAVRSDLQRQSKQLARDLATRILGREVRG